MIKLSRRLSAVSALGIIAMLIKWSGPGWIKAFSLQNRYLCIPSRLQTEEHPAGLGVMQFCGCSSHTKRSDEHVYLAIVRCSPDTVLSVCILMKSPVLGGKKKTHTILNMTLDTISVSINPVILSSSYRAKLNTSILPQTGLQLTVQGYT